MSMRSIFLFCSEKGSCVSFSLNSWNSDPWMVIGVPASCSTCGVVAPADLYTLCARDPAALGSGDRQPHREECAMSFFERAKAAANDLAAKADAEMKKAGISTPGGASPAGGGPVPDRALRDLGVLAYLEATGRPVDP